MSRARRKKEEMNGNSLGVLPPGALAGAERSEGERSEPQRSAAAAKAGADSPLTPRKRGPKSKRHPLEEENQKLQRQNARLTEDLRKAHIIIDVQKKVAALLGHPILEQDPEEES